jgi:hypothetical protein
MEITLHLYDPQEMLMFANFTAALAQHRHVTQAESRIGGVAGSPEETPAPAPEAAPTAGVTPISDAPSKRKARAKKVVEPTAPAPTSTDPAQLPLAGVVPVVFTPEEVAVMLKSYVEKRGLADATKLLADFGAKRVGDVKPESMPFFIARIQEGLK